MRICIITKYIPPVSTDGIPRNRWEYARQFVALGHEVHIITSGLKGVERIEGGIYIHEIPVWDEEICPRLFTSGKYDDLVRNRLRYSFLVYERIKALNTSLPIDIIDSPLWDIEGYITKLRLPHIPMVVRLETTSMLLKEILEGETPEKDRINDIETHFMDIAEALVFDSWSIMKETERLYEFDFSTKQYAVIHHGIELEKEEQLPEIKHNSVNGSGEKIKVLSVGRLEKRKGSDVLVKIILPDLLEKHPQVEVHLVGKDSGEWDGFKNETGLGYHDYIKKNFKKYLNKQLFIYGYVEDKQLDELYDQADIVLALSKYESFGLLYVESMRKGKPLIVFNTGSVPEIFEGGKEAVIVPFNSPEMVVDAIAYLKKNPAMRHQIGAAARHKLYTHFSAEIMGSKCAKFFEEVAFRKGEERIFQVMNCLTDKDGVSNTTIGYDQLLKNATASTTILATWPSPPVQHLTRPIEDIRLQESDLVIYHYWNYCDRGLYFNKLFLPKKVMFFHNFTSPNFFDKDDPAYEATSRGFEQLPNLGDFDVYVCHTQYSADILQQAIKKPITTFLIPPVVERNEILSRPFNKTVATKGPYFQIIFISSIAPHKKQTDLVRFFDYYHKKYNPQARLTIIGGGSEKYVKVLKDLVKELKLENLVKITGKVSDEDLYGYYRSADLYLSMCEHEGFGAPLAEAMGFELPVAAYSCTAVPETIGQNGLLFEKKDFELVSSLVEKVRTDKNFRKEVIQKQNEQLANFSPEVILNSLKKLNELAHINQRKRISKLMESGQTFMEETVFHNDNRLKKHGAVQLRDGQRLFIDKNSDADSCVDVEDAFDDFEVNFLSHPWSGKVKVFVNDSNEQEFDLYSSESRIRTVKLDTKIPAGTHKISIRPSGEKNSFSHGNEVYLESVTLYKNYRPQKKHITRYKLDKPQEVVVPELTELPDDGKYVEMIHEVSSFDPKILYYGSWATKDKYFMFADGLAKDNFFEFTANFSRLDMIFISHTWSGKIKIQIDDEYSEVINLYNSGYEEKKFRIQKVFEEKEHRVIVRSLGTKDRGSKGYEIFFKGLILNRKVKLDIDNEYLSNGFKVSVIINTYNRAKHLEALLQELAIQTYPFYEIVVVNGPSTDDTKEVLEKYAGKIKVFDCPEANLSMSRNIGIENSAGDYVAFIDDDALPCNRRWIENFVHFIIYNSDKKIGTVGGPVKHKDTEHYEFKNGASSDYAFQIFREEELTSHVLDGVRWVQGVPGGNNIVLKKALYEIGGFDEKFIYYLDETDMCIRLARKGYAIVNDPINFIRHFKAPSAIRKSVYDIRWDIIARSDTFYSMKNGHDAYWIRLLKTLKHFRSKHFVVELKNAFRSNKINKLEYQKYRKMLKKGFWQGLRWGMAKQENGSYLKKTSDSFLQFKKEESTIKNIL